MLFNPSAPMAVHNGTQYYMSVVKFKTYLIKVTLKQHLFNSF